ncbi:MAG: hypothetical protein LBS36_04300 [Oscillospiraceae bacterium]|nr:hypothetical protein [Oscillospiraceae bacterium]
MKRPLKIAVIIAAAGLMLLLIVKIVLPLSIMMPQTILKDYTVKSEQFKEYSTDYKNISSFVQGNIDFFKSRGGITMGIYEYADEEIFLVMSNEERESAERIGNENTCSGAYIKDNTFIFGGVDGSAIMYSFDGKVPFIHKSDQGIRYKTIKLEESWYALVIIPL